MALPQENNLEDEEKDIKMSSWSQQPIELNDLLSALKKLVEVQTEYTIVSAGKTSKDLKQGLNKRIEGIRTWVTSEERKYGARQDDAKAIMNEYSKMYDEIYNTYNEAKNATIIRRDVYQTEEQYEMMQLATTKNDIASCKDNIKVWKTQINRVENSPEFKQYSKCIEDIKSEIDAAVRTGDVDAIEKANLKLKENQEKREALYGHYKQSYDFDTKKLDDLSKDAKVEKHNIKELRSYIKEQEDSMKKYAKNSIEAIQSASKDKNKQLAVIQKQNAVSKFFSSVMAKIGGAKKFANNVIAPLKKEVESLKNDKIPSLKNTIKQAAEKQEQKFQENMEKVKETATKIIEKGRNGVTKVGDGVKGTGKVALATACLTGICAKYVGTKIVTTLGEITVEDVAKSISEKAQQTRQGMRDIIDAGKEKKNNFLQKIGNSIKNKIDARIENLSRKQDKIELSNGERE